MLRITRRQLSNSCGMISKINVTQKGFDSKRGKETDMWIITFLIRNNGTLGYTGMHGNGIGVFT